MHNFRTRKLRGTFNSLGCSHNVGSVFAICSFSLSYRPTHVCILAVHVFDCIEDAGGLNSAAFTVLLWTGLSECLYPRDKI